jgi:hypothetical protein
MSDHQTSKDVTAGVVGLARRNPEFKRHLLREIVAESQVRDIAIDQESQVRMLMTMRAGDHVQITFEPGDATDPQESVARIVQNAYDEVLKGVTLRTPEGTEGVLVDQGEPQGVMFSDGGNGPGYQVVEMRLNRWWPKLAQDDDPKKEQDEAD